MKVCIVDMMIIISLLYMFFVLFISILDFRFVFKCVELYCIRGYKIV